MELAVGEFNVKFVIKEYNNVANVVLFSFLIASNSSLQSSTASALPCIHNLQKTFTNSVLFIFRLFWTAERF